MARLRDDYTGAIEGQLKGLFKKSAYAETAKLTKYGWLLQLALRMDIYRDLARWKSTLAPRGSFYFEWLLETLKKAPILDINCAKLGSINRCYCLRETLDGYPDDNRQKVVEYCDGPGDPRCSVPRKRNVFDYTRSVLFRVDLDAPDRVLTEHFWSELARARKSQRKTRRDDTFATHKWFRMGLLPYMDVRLWALRNGIGDIPDVVMGKKVLPDWTKGKQFIIRAETKEKAEAFFAMSPEAYGRRISLMRATDAKFAPDAN